MNIKTTKGDLLEYYNDSDCDVIAHCCNCQGVMGSGIALQIKEEIPGAYLAYKQHEQDAGGLFLGTISAFIDDKTKAVVNLHAQNLYGYDGSRFVNYEALYETLRQTKNLMETKGFKTLGVPYKMACDRAGGDWRVVIAMIETIFEDSNIDILVVEYSK